jgi:hypothetical protein
MAWRIKQIIGLPVRQLLTPDREGAIAAAHRFRALGRAVKRSISSRS